MLLALHSFRISISSLFNIFHFSHWFFKSMHFDTTIKACIYLSRYKISAFDKFWTESHFTVTSYNLQHVCKNVEAWDLFLLVWWVGTIFWGSLSNKNECKSKHFYLTQFSHPLSFFFFYFKFPLLKHLLTL